MPNKSNKAKRKPHLNIRRGEWVVVCDGAKALVLENLGDAKFPNLRTKEVHEQPAPKTSEQGSDAPGRTFKRAATNYRSAMEQTDWHDRAEKDFLEKLIGRLDTAVRAGETTGIVLVAPPRALGMIRQAYGSANDLRAALRAEIDKDLVKLPLDEIEKYLVG
jgi:protein required for attachment to host cells